mgnify:CR=1 FL=1
MKWIGAQVFDFDTYLRNVSEDGDATTDVFNCLFTAPSGKIGHGNFTVERGRTYTFGADNNATTSIYRKAHSDDDGGDLWIAAGHSTAGLTDKDGGDLILYAGKGTGAGTPGAVHIYISNPTTSGTDLQVAVDGGPVNSVFNFKHTGLSGNREFAITGSTDGSASGDIVYFGGTTSMSVGQLYHYKSDGTWEKADADDNTKCDGLLAVALGAASDVNGMLLRGMVTMDHDVGAVGDVLYIRTAAGAIGSSAPAGNNNIVRIVGYCLHASNGQIWFDPDNTFVQVTA